MRTTLDFLSLITEGNESQNIGCLMATPSSCPATNGTARTDHQGRQDQSQPRLFSGVRNRSSARPGSQGAALGASLDQALAAAGGQKLLRGQVEFIRFNRDGSTDRRKFFVNGANPVGSYKNPILMAGDVVRVNDSLFSATVTVLNEITAPAVGVYSVYSLFSNFQ